MLCWKCDVCGALGEARTSAAEWRAMPIGWHQRNGTVCVGRKRERIEVALHVCSTRCAKLYDEAEGRDVGFAWFVSNDATAPVGRPVRPIRVQRPRRT